jgi:Flp pilus assembly pilin Flp
MLRPLHVLFGNSFERRKIVGEIRRLIEEEAAQTTAEYALVILGGAAVAGGLIAWAASGKSVKNFFSKIFEKLTNGL